MSGARGLRIVERPEGSAIVLVVAGDVDMANAPALAQAVGVALRRRPAILVIDLTGVNFLTTAGMSILIQAHDRSKEIATVCRIVADQALVLRPMELLALDQILELYSDVDHALRGRTEGAP